jgi:hypothetical protein
MDVFCTQDFKSELESLLKDNKYKSYEKLIIKFFFGNNPLSATIINGVNPPIPLLKKRIGGKKALRVYYYLFEIKGKIFLTHVHPKIGTQGKSNISSTHQQELMATLVKSIKSKEVFKIQCVKGKIIFT